MLRIQVEDKKKSNNPVRALCQLRRKYYNPFTNVACMALWIIYTVAIDAVFDLEFLRTSTVKLIKIKHTCSGHDEE